MANKTNRKNVKQTTKVEEVKYPVEDFVADKKASEAETKEEDIDVKSAVIKNNKRLNLRTNKSKSAGILAVLEPNTKLTVVNYDPKAEWTQVTAINDDAFGDPAYVMTEFIEVK